MMFQDPQTYEGSQATGSGGLTGAAESVMRWLFGTKTANGADVPSASQSSGKSCWPDPLFCVYPFVAGNAELDPQKPVPGPFELMGNGLKAGLSYLNTPLFLVVVGLALALVLFNRVSRVGA